jgi:CPA1 family monovalent cation:H+ antiporter
VTTGGITGLVLTLALLLVVIAAIQPLARRLGLASNVLLAAVGVAIGALAAFLLFTSFTDVFNEAARAVVYLRIDSQTIITVFLPLLLFQTALTIDVRRLLDDIAPILLLAVVAVVVTTAAIGLGLSAIFGVPILGCLLLGAIVATTDPAAVVAIFRDIGAPARLTRLVEGESLLNDATAIALFSVLMAALVTARATGVEEPGSAMLLDAANDLAVGLIGGAVFGLVVGRLVVAGLLLLDDIKAAEATLTLAGAYIIFVVGEYTLGVSGVVAAVVAGLVVSALGRSHVAPENWRHLLNVWEQIAFWAGSMIFVLAALIVPRLMEEAVGQGLAQLSGGDPVGWPARRGHAGAGAGCGRGARPVRRAEALRGGDSDRLCAVHAVHQRHHAPAADFLAGAGPAVTGGRGAAPTGAGPVADRCQGGGRGCRTAL